jgi:hypothetical protein
MTKVWPCVQYGDGEEIYDADFNDVGDLVMGTSARKLQIFSTKPSDDAPAPLQTIERPSMTKDLSCTFRAAKCAASLTIPLVASRLGAQVRERHDIRILLHGCQRLAQARDEKCETERSQVLCLAVGREDVEAGQDEGDQPATADGI